MKTRDGVENHSMNFRMSFIDYQRTSDTITGYTISKKPGWATTLFQKAKRGFTVFVCQCDESRKIQSKNLKAKFDLFLQLRRICIKEAVGR